MSNTTQTKVTAKAVKAVSGKRSTKHEGGKVQAGLDFSAMGHQCAKEMLEASNGVLKTWAQVLKVASTPKHIESFRNGYVVECKAASENGKGSAMVRASECNRFFKFAADHASDALKLLESGIGYHKLLAALPKATTKGAKKATEKATTKAPQKVKSADSALAVVSENLALVKDSEDSVLPLLNSLITKMEKSTDEYLIGLAKEVSKAWVNYNKKAGAKATNKKAA